AAEAEIGNLTVGRWDNAVHAPGLVAHLNAQPRGHIEPAVPVHAHAIGSAVVCAIGHMQVVVALLVGERTVRLDLVAVDPVRPRVGHVEQRLIGGKSNAVGEFQPAVHHPLAAPRGNVPDFARVRAIPTGVGDIDATVVTDDQVVAAEAVGDHV